jgi:thiol-disulfide isomerase/thioredoxin
MWHRPLMNLQLQLSLLLPAVVVNTMISCDGFVMRTNNSPLTLTGSDVSNVNVNASTPKSLLFPSQSQYHVNTSLQSKSIDDEISASTSTKPSLFIDLTPQERILKEALGIEPETPLEKQKRQEERKTKLQKIQTEKTKNIIVAVVAFSAACLNYFYQYTHPVTSLSLLADMQRKSDDISLIGHNGKPTVVDFWAPWCENCKSAAPTLALIEDEYRNRVNFVMVNGDLGENWPMIERFGVDAIPHLAMVGSDGFVETALIGPIPASVLRADLDTMIENGKRRNVNAVSPVSEQDQNNQSMSTKIELPYTMYDAFRSRPDLRQVNF